MPYTYTIHADRELVVLVLSGEVTGKTLIHALRSLLADEAWRPGYARLWDGRGIELCCITPEDIKALFSLLNEEQERIRSCGAAFVAVRDLDHTIFELLRVRAKWRPARVFRTIDEAHAWISELPRQLSSKAA